MKYQVENTVDPKVLLSTNSDVEFVSFVKMIRNENEDTFMISTPNQAKYYINNFCDNLELSQLWKIKFRIGYC